MSRWLYSLSTYTVLKSIVDVRGGLVRISERNYQTLIEIKQWSIYYPRAKFFKRFKRASYKKKKI